MPDCGTIAPSLNSCAMLTSSANYPRFAKPSSTGPRSGPTEGVAPPGSQRSAPGYGRETEAGILVGEFAARVVEDRLIAQPFDCFARAGGRPFLGQLGLAQRRMEAA